MKEIFDGSTFWGIVAMIVTLFTVFLPIIIALARDAGTLVIAAFTLNVVSILLLVTAMVGGGPLGFVTTLPLILAAWFAALMCGIGAFFANRSEAARLPPPK